MTSVGVLDGRSEPFGRGDAVVWRSCHPDRLGYAYAGRVLADEPSFAAIVQAPGALRARPTGRRGGPRGRNTVPGGWDGGHRVTPWDGPVMVRVHPVGCPYAVLRAWSDDAGAFSSWYVNLERPWRRTAIGFDTRDHLLDVVVDHDLGGWQLKDADELVWATDAGIYDEAEAEAIRDAGRRAIRDVEERRWPFDEAAWAPFEPDAGWSPPELPAAWNHW
ncbi:MAG: DUF402 domain-containing protein [Actinomycetota bacterium]|nr:DUF402 domain-containing protein [Actinomycetota bacterium]